MSRLVAATMRTSTSTDLLAAEFWLNCPSCSTCRSLGLQRAPTFTLSPISSRKWCPFLPARLPMRVVAAPSERLFSFPEQLAFEHLGRQRRALTLSRTGNAVARRALVMALRHEPPCDAALASPANQDRARYRRPPITFSIVCISGCAPQTDAHPDRGQYLTASSVISVTRRVFAIAS